MAYFQKVMFVSKLFSTNLLRRVHLKLGTVKKEVLS